MRDRLRLLRPAASFAVGANELHATARVLEAQPRVELGESATTTTTGGARGDRRRPDDPADRLRPSRHGGQARRASDTMMLVRLSPRAKAVTVLSVPRDLKVTIPGKGTRSSTPRTPTAASR